MLQVAIIFDQLIVGVAQAARFRCGVAMAMCMDYEGHEVRGMEAGSEGGKRTCTLQL